VYVCVSVTRWRAIPYGECSTTCGGGHKLRHIQCVQESLEGVLTPAQERLCTEPRPLKTVGCNPSPCPPSWTIGDWSEVNLSTN